MDYCKTRRPTGEVLWNKVGEWAGQISEPDLLARMAGYECFSWGQLGPSYRAALDIYAASRTATVDAIDRYFPPAPPAPMFVQDGPVPIDETIFEQGDAIGDRDEHRAAAVDAAYAAAPAAAEEATTSIDDVDEEGDLDDDGDEDLDDGGEDDDGEDDEPSARTPYRSFPVADGADDEGLDAEDDGDRQEIIARMDDEMGAVPVCDDPGDGSACGTGEAVDALEVADEPEAIPDGDDPVIRETDPPRAPRRRR